MIFPAFTDDPFPFRLLYSDEVITTAQTPVIKRTDFKSCSIEYVRSGRGFLESGGRHYDCGPDSVFLLHHHSNHRYGPVREEPWNKLFFAVGGPLADQLFQAYGMQEVCFLPDARDLRPFFDAFWQFHGTEPDLHRQAAILFHQFVEQMARLVRQSERDGGAFHALPPVLRLLKQRLDGELDAPFRLEEFAREQQFSSAHLIRAFRKAFGCSPMEYRLRRKQDAAELLLSHTLLTVKEIAIKLGFCDQYAFSKFFRVRRGVSPGVFREG